MGILHGYLLDGSGSNLWTQSIARALCRLGETVHLVCQEPHPERFDFVARAVDYDASLRPRVLLDRRIDYPGRCILHKPALGGLLPVFVGDRYEEHDRVVPMPDLSDADIEDYVERNARALRRVVEENGVGVVLANHAVLMPTVAQRVAEARPLPFAIMPHGSAIEYVVKVDARYHRLAAAAFEGARRVFAVSPEIRDRLLGLFPGQRDLEGKTVPLGLGVDTELFSPVPRRSRPEEIRRLVETLRGAGAGRSPALVRDLRRRLRGSMSRAELLEAQAASTSYEGRLPDADCARKLSAIDWNNDAILIFVGRLIAVKGVHLLPVVMPSILERLPAARLLVVGHGPLRETLESLVWALESGEAELLRNILRWGELLEGRGRRGPFVHAQRYIEWLEARGALGGYLRAARVRRLSERVVFTGYLDHRRLRHLFPCGDVALFPSLVAEAGPLVFLEAMASGILPVGVAHGGIAASIDSVAPRLPGAVTAAMRLSADPGRTAADIVARVPRAVGLASRHGAALRRAAVERHDWESVAAAMLEALRGLR